MLIPSIDLKGGRVVQLIQGERLAIETDDIDTWIERFSGFSKIQLIDLDAAMGSGTNDQLIRIITSQLPCRVGGGIRTVERAQEVLGYGATAVIVGSSLFKNDRPHTAFARRLAGTVGAERIIAAVDSKGGRVAIKGWRETISLTAIEAVTVLEPHCAEFLYTHVDREGLMAGTDLAAVIAVRRATTRRVTAAGGITTQDEIDVLDKAGIDAVVGMAIYTGRLSIAPSSKHESG